MGEVIPFRLFKRNGKIKARYKIIEETDDYILIKDLCPWDQYMTVTNDAEEVVAEIAPILNGRRLEYIDSEGRRDQLIVSNGRFIGYGPSIREPQALEKAQKGSRMGKTLELKVFFERASKKSRRT